MAKQRTARTTRRRTTPQKTVRRRRVAGTAPVLDILVIDDDEIFLRVASLILKRLGHRALAASTIAQGQQRLLDGTPISVILLDLFMPEDARDSPAFLAWLHTHPALQLARVLACTAADVVLDQALVTRVRGLGVLRMVTKPLDPRDLAAKLAEQLATLPPVLARPKGVPPSKWRRLVGEFDATTTVGVREILARPPTNPEGALAAIEGGARSIGAGRIAWLCATVRQTRPLPEGELGIWARRLSTELALVQRAHARRP